MTAYFTALADADAAAAALYSPQVVFLDDVGEPGGVREASAWNERLLAVPNLVFEPRSIIGDGWAGPLGVRRRHLDRRVERGPRGNDVRGA